ncbi:MAG: hypothetical protein ACI9TV_001600 [Sulfurimonas sp.]|jgi:hypothetical protein|uniref:hypothetical protein n=1 Tax=Sulfurimonas sp. TaxID=2022749 RepID=UPI0039E5B184
MKKILFTIFLPVVILAQSFLISNIPLPKTYIQNLDPYDCGEECLQEFIDREMFFSFLAYADTKLENEIQNEVRNINIGILNLGSTIINTKLKIAILLPYKKIGKYSSSTTNASFAYLITKNQPFELKSYKIESESQEDIHMALTNIIEDGFSYVIAPLTTKGAEVLTELNPQINIFFPTINKKDSSSTSPYLYFGGIDYRAQSDLLLKEAASPLIIFHDNSSIGKKLARYEENTFCYEITPETNATNEFGPYIVPASKIRQEDKEAIKFSISRKTTNLEHYLKENEDINGSTCIINTPIVKTSMVMSQLTLYDANTTNILSTQINYDPLILSMTQYVDREKMLIANSITEHNNVLIETNAILSNDIEYDWINYTTTVAMDYFFHLITNAQREYNIELINQQMSYPIELLKPSLSRFIKYIPTPEEVALEETED